MAPPHRDRLLQGVLRAVSLALMLMLLGLFAAGVPVRARLLSSIVAEDTPLIIPGPSQQLTAVYYSRLGTAEAAALSGLGFSIGFYALYQLVFEIGLVVVCTLVALVIFWRRAEGWLTVWVALVLVLMSTTAVSSEVYLVTNAWAGWQFFSTVAGLLGMASFLHILYLAPDGRFVPRSNLRLAAAFGGSTLSLSLYSVWNVRQLGEAYLFLILLAAVVAWLILSLVGLVGQVHRYRHVSGPVERQQIKWVGIGLAAVTAAILVNAVSLFAATQSSGSTRLLIFLVRAPFVYLCLVGLPLSLAFAILRYRLWDIDLIIRRTLVYGSLTATLVAFYFGSVITLQTLVGGLTGQNQPALVTVLSTLALAALFNPLRRRIQSFIDRRFFRRKYNAAQVLAAFSTTLRDETDLARLSHRLEAVVDQTMQPAATTLWLKPPT